MNSETNALLSSLLKKLAESTGLNCRFFKAKDGNWYMGLEKWDRRDAYDHYGPFPSKEEAVEFLDANFANPGGWSTDASGKQPVPADARDPQSSFRGSLGKVRRYW